MCFTVVLLGRRGWWMGGSRLQGLGGHSQAPAPTDARAACGRALSIVGRSGVGALWAAPGAPRLSMRNGPGGPLGIVAAARTHHARPLAAALSA